MKATTPIKRFVTIELPLLKCWNACFAGQRGSEIESEYLDADAFDDIYVNPLPLRFADDYKHKLSEENQGASALFPVEVVRSLEYAYRQALADSLGNARRTALATNLLRIIVDNVDYLGCDDDHNEVQITGFRAAVIDVEVLTPQAKVKLTVENPEHLINEITGHGTSVVYWNQPATHSELETGMLEAIYAWFNRIATPFKAVLSGGEDIWEIFDSRSPGVTEHFNEEIQYLLQALDSETIIRRIFEAIEANRIKDFPEAFTLAVRLTDFDKKTLALEINSALKKKEDSLAAARKNITEQTTD